jgi:hypothetical protein
MPERILSLFLFPNNSSQFSELESGGSLSIDDLPRKKDIRSRSDLASDQPSFSEARTRTNAAAGDRAGSNLYAECCIEPLL